MVCGCYILLYFLDSLPNYHFNWISKWLKYPVYALEIILLCLALRPPLFLIIHQELEQLHLFSFMGKMHCFSQVVAHPRQVM